MSYTGSITIIDDGGNVVFERELSSDQIIETLIGARSEAQPAPAPEAPRPKLGRPKKGGEVAGDRRACCGSMTRGRHRAGCPEAPSAKPGAAPAPNRRTVDNRKPFSEGTWNKVKQRREEGEGIDFIVSETGLDPEEVRRADLSDDYDDYLTIA